MVSTDRYNKKNFYSGAAVGFAIFLWFFFSSAPDYDDLSSVEGQVAATHFVDTKYNDYWLLELQGKPIINAIRLPRIKNLPRVKAGDVVAAKVFDDQANDQPQIWQISRNGKVLFSYDDFVRVELERNQSVMRIMGVFTGLFLLLGFIRRE